MLKLEKPRFSVWFRSGAFIMAAPRNLGNDGGRLRDEENANEDDSPTTKKPAGVKIDGRFPLTRWEFTVALGVFVFFSIGLFCIYLTMPAAEYGRIRLPRTISDLRMLKYVVCDFSFVEFKLVDVWIWENYVLDHGFFVVFKWKVGLNLDKCLRCGFGLALEKYSSLGYLENKIVDLRNLLFNAKQMMD